jgi:hypothetical protein
MKREVLDAIYKYYPTGIEYSSSEYRTTEQYRNRQSRIREKLTYRRNDNRFAVELKSLFADYALVDWTAEDTCCYEYKFLLHKDQGILDDDIELIKELDGRRTDLRIFISALGPYYYYFVENTTFDSLSLKWEFTTIPAQSKKLREDLEKLRIYLEGLGYSALSTKEVKEVVANIETECRYRGEAIVFDCLFTDMVTVSD